MAKDKYYYHQLPLTKNMQTSDTFTGERKCISIPNHKRKIKNTGDVPPLKAEILQGFYRRFLPERFHFGELGSN